VGRNERLGPFPPHPLRLDQIHFQLLPPPNRPTAPPALSPTTTTSLLQRSRKLARPRAIHSRLVEPHDSRRSTRLSSSAFSTYVPRYFPVQILSCELTTFFLRSITSYSSVLYRRFSQRYLPLPSTYSLTSRSDSLLPSRRGRSRIAFHLVTQAE